MWCNGYKSTNTYTNTNTLHCNLLILANSHTDAPLFYWQNNRYKSINTNTAFHLSYIALLGNWYTSYIYIYIIYAQILLELSCHIIWLMHIYAIARQQHKWFVTKTSPHFSWANTILQSSLRCIYNNCHLFITATWPLWSDIAWPCKKTKLCLFDFFNQACKIFFS